MDEDHYRQAVKAAEAEFEQRMQHYVLPERRRRAEALRKMGEKIAAAREAFYPWWRAHVSKGVEPWEK